MELIKKYSKKITSAIAMTVISFISLLILNISTVAPSVAGPMPVGTDTMPLQGGPGKPTPEWAKRHPKLTTAQTANIPHSCNKDLHAKHCIKKCVKRSQHIHTKRKVQGTVIKK
jgi:hypothetical protein